MVILFMSLYATTQLHYSIGMAGVVMALFGIGSLCGAFIGGKLTDKNGFYRVMYGSLILGGCMFLILGFLQNFYLVCLVTFLSSLFADAFRPSSTAAVGTYSTPETYTRSIGLVRLAINLGFTIGPAIGGFLAEFNYSLIFLVDGITCILAGVLVFYSFRNRKATKTEKTNNVDSQLSEQSPYRDSIYMVFSLFCFLYAVAFFQLICTLPLYYKTVHHLAEGQIGWLMALNGFLVVAVEMILIYKIEKSANSLTLIIGGSALLLLNYLVLPFAESMVLLVVSMVIISFSEMLAMPFMSSFLMQRAGLGNRGQYAAVYSLSWGLAQIVAPLLSTFFIENYGFTPLWYILAIISLCVVLGMFYVAGLLKTETKNNYSG